MWIWVLAQLLNNGMTIELPWDYFLTSETTTTTTIIILILQAYFEHYNTDDVLHTQEMTALFLLWWLMREAEGQTKETFFHMETDIINVKEQL